MKKLNIVIPMAGAGSRFSDAGYSDPKPLIQVNGKSMIQLVIENLTPRIDHRFIFICQNAHVKKYNLGEKLSMWAPNCQIVEIDSLTEGAACTVLTAKSLINDENPLMIANSDQYIDFNINEYIKKSLDQDLDGLIMTMEADNPKWSFVALDARSNVTRVAEKEVISNNATVGIYNFTMGKDFVKFAEQMIINNERVNGEFYVAPVYNNFIKMGKIVKIFKIGTIGKGMYGLGTPQDLDFFINHFKNNH